jgi:hypothetical protein
VPTLAQEQNTVDPEVRQQIEAVLMKLGEAYRDWENVAPSYGQQAIEKNYADHFSSSSGEFVDRLCSGECNRQQNISYLGL